ncbi:MAG: hypothetical protein AAFP97_11525, partial [Pseudomonadota bacterium]
MITRLIATTTALVLTACETAPQTVKPEGTSYDVYFLGGQSNMDGFGYNDQLPDALNQTQEGVYIYA